MKSFLFVIILLKLFHIYFVENIKKVVVSCCIIECKFKRVVEKIEGFSNMSLKRHAMQS